MISSNYSGRKIFNSIASLTLADLSASLFDFTPWLDCELLLRVKDYTNTELVKAAHENLKLINDVCRGGIEVSINHFESLEKAGRGGIDKRWALERIASMNPKLIRRAAEDAPYADAIDTSQLNRSYKNEHWVG